VSRICCECSRSAETRNRCRRLVSYKGCAETNRERARSLQRRGSIYRTYVCTGRAAAPRGRDWLYEVNFDGYRCLADRDSTGVTLWSRQANRFTDQFPTVAEACKHLLSETLLDGEIIALDQNGRVAFNMLQHHRSQAQAILFYVFDLIIHRGRRLIHVPLDTRRELLSDIAADLRTRTPLIGLSDTLDITPPELIPLVKSSASRVSSLSARTPATNPASAVVHGSSTR
jgi:hypothetical protein